MKNIFKYSPGFLAGVILSSAFAGAAAANSNLITDTIDELWVFVAGDPVLASQVNENFEYLEIKIDEEVSFLSDDVIANTVSILNNEDGVGVNQSAISQVDSNLSSFQSSQSVRDGDQDVLIADNGARIDTLEGGASSPGFFYPSQLLGYSWDIAFIQTYSSNGVNMSPSSFVMSFELDSNDIYQASAYGDYLPEPFGLDYDGNVGGGRANLPSVSFNAMGILRHVSYKSSDALERLVFSGAMSQDKTIVRGEWALRNTGSSFGGFAEGTFVATRQ